jgi:hypothetical protein
VPPSRVSPHTGGIGNSPRVARDAEGRLFFATYDAFAVVDRSRINQQSFAPPIVLETVLVNRRPVTPARFLKVRRTRRCSVRIHIAESPQSGECALSLSTGGP